MITLHPLGITKTYACDVYKQFQHIHTAIELDTDIIDDETDVEIDTDATEM